MKRKWKQAALLPIVFLLVMLMSAGVFAAPKLNRKTVTVYRWQVPVTDTKGYVIRTFYQLAQPLTVSGLSDGAEIINSYFGNKYTYFFDRCLTEDGATELSVDQEKCGKNFRIKQGTYKTSIKIKDNGKKIFLPLKVKVKNTPLQIVNYIKVNGKKYTAGLKNNSGYVYMKLPKGKKVRFGCGLKKGYKIKEAYTDAFSSVGRVDITKQKIVLRKGMVLHIVYMKRFNPQIWGELTIIVK